MQWVMMQGGRTELWAVGTELGSPQGSQDLRHLQVVINWSVSPSPLPVVSNLEPSVQLYPTSVLYPSSPWEPTIQVLLPGAAVATSLGSFSGLGRGFVFFFIQALYHLHGKRFPAVDVCVALRPRIGVEELSVKATANN